MTTTKHELHPELIAYEQERLAAVTKKELAEARHLNAQADGAAYEVQVAKITAEAVQLERDERFAADFRHHIFHFNGTVSATTANACRDVLATWSRLDPECDIEIVFNSPGGSVIDGMALWDYLHSLKAKGHKLTTTSRGYAASMAGILLQAGDVRRMGSESYLMIHELSASTGGKIGEMQDSVKFYERICARVVDIFVTRSGGKISKPAFIKGWLRTDWWIDSVEALKLGFIDEIV